MGRSDSKASATPTTVKGFSTRLNVFLDWARFPAENRFSRGAARFGVVYNTFRSWCTADKTPGTYNDLLALVRQVLELVKHILDDGPGRPQPDAIAAWLLAGDAVPNPFSDGTDLRAVVDLHFQISDVAAQQGIHFNELPRKTQNFILSQVRALMPADTEDSAESRQIDNTVLPALRLMLETTRRKSK